MSDGFLSRWARRKRDVLQSERVAPPVEAGVVSPDAEAVEAGASPPEVETEPDAIADLLADLPSLTDLTAETDLIPFLRAGVPAALRNAALRKMWSVDPAIRDFVSEAREYAYDWNTPGGVPGLGPLLPSDDVKAMLSRMINREPDAPLPPDAEPLLADGSDPAPTAGPESGPEPAVALDPLDPERPADSSEAPTPAVVRPVEPVTTVRLRRHGGALPS